MRKILYYIPTFPTFSQNFITREVEALIKSGKVDISILSLEKGEKGRVPDVLNGKILYFHKSKFQRVISVLLYALFHPFRFIFVCFKYGKRLLSLGTAISMLSFVRKVKPSLIHANWITEGALIANMLSDLSKIPFSIECHAEDIWLSNPRSITERIKDSKFVVTCTKNNVLYLKKFIPERYLSKLITIYHFINFDLFEGKMSEVNNKAPVIYMVGRMVEKKGFSYMVLAARILKLKGLNFELRIAGDPGTEKERLLKMVSDMSLMDRVKFPSEVSFEEHKHNFFEADIFVAPSIKAESGDLDGLPNVIIEAMLCGLPVVATKISAIPELVEDNVNGFLVDEKDERMLADRVEILLKDPEKRKGFGLSARSKVISMFGFENTIMKLENLFKS